MVSPQAPTAPASVGAPADEADDVVHLPTDGSRAPGSKLETATHAFSLRLPTLRGKPASSSPAQVVAAFSALVYRYSGQESFRFDLGLDLGEAPTGEGNGKAATARLCAVAADVSGELTATALVADAERHLARTAAASERPSRGPVGLSLIGAGKDRLLRAVGAVASGPLELHVIVSTAAANNALEGVVVYDTGLFFPATVARLVGHLEVLLGGIVRDGATTVARLPMLTQAEVGQLLTEWRPRFFERGTPLVHKQFEAHAARNPDATAIIFRDRRMSYGELDRRANQLAHQLVVHGVRRGSRVAVCVEPSFEILVCILAIWKAGGAFVPLDPSYPSERLAVILDDTGPVLIITDARAVGRLPMTSFPVLNVDHETRRLEALPTTPPLAAAAPDATAYIIYTSGTTGKPKGVMVSQANLLHYVLVAADRYRWNQNDVFVAFARFSFSISFWELFSPLVAGASLIILERDHVLDFPRLVPTLQGATVIHASPSLLRRLCAYVDDNQIPISSFHGLRHVSSGGDLVAADLLENLKRVFEKAEIFVIYGCSEIACMGTTFPATRDEMIKKTFVGKPFENVAVRLYDPNGNLVPIGVPGEICFAGAGIAQGYLNREELTAEKFVLIDGERYYRTGDLGRYDPQGNVEIVGRSDFQIKLRGFRIELGEIEATLRKAPAVREGVVAARPLTPGSEDKSLVAYIVWNASRAGDRKEVRRFLQEKLPDYMIPAAYVVLEAMPTNMNGKLDRRALPAPTPEDLASARTIVPARNETERKLIEIWETILGTSPIGIRDNFFDVGGTSLISLPLMIQVEKVFGRALPMSTLLTDATIEQMAVALGESDEQWRDTIITLAEGGPGTPLYLVHDGEGESLPYRQLAQRLRGERPIYAIHPRSRGPFPLLQTRLHEIADFYAAEIRRVQPQGPYLLGGLCIGGFIALEVARRLRAEGQEVPFVALLDAMHVQAEPAGWASKKLSRFSSSLREGAPNLGLQRRVVAAVKIASSKVSNVIAWETKSRTTRLKNDLRVRALRYVVDNDLPIPSFLRGIPVRVILHFAEKEYVAPKPYQGEVALLRATKKDPVFDGTVIDDTPYRELFKAHALGWEGHCVPEVQVSDMPGGHSSMLQSPNVDVVADALRAHLQRIEGGIPGLSPGVQPGSPAVSASSLR